MGIYIGPRDINFNVLVVADLNGNLFSEEAKDDSHTKHFCFIFFVSNVEVSTPDRDIPQIYLE